MDTGKRSAQRDRSASASASELTQAADKMATFHRISWKEALGKAASPAIRLHRYRSAHTRVLEDALSNLECVNKREFATCE